LFFVDGSVDLGVVRGLVFAGWFLKTGEAPPPSLWLCLMVWFLFWWFCSQGLIFDLVLVLYGGGFDDVVVVWSLDMFYVGYFSDLLIPRRWWWSGCLCRTGGCLFLTLF
jgi:hypothetical protein